MEKKLRWKVVGIEENIETIISFLRTELESTPSQNTKTIRKIGRWVEDLIFIRNAIKNIENTLQPELEKKIRFKLESSSILTAALFQPSVKNLFNELQTFFADKGQFPVSEENLMDLTELCEAGKVLALVGDAALDLAVLPYVWESEISNVGKITQKRSEYVSNNHLATVCDKWNLYDYRIHFDPPTSEKSDIDHVKGTLVEAVFGIIFLFYGLDAVNKAVPLLRGG
ncbi:MAG: ribonuclease III domain-containing protein [Candidatus Thorarchaeota archaeon]